MLAPLAIVHQVEKIAGKPVTIDGVIGKIICASVHQVVRVGGLVVARCKRVGHEHARHGKRGDLGDGGGTGARDHEVCRRESLSHVGDVGYDLPALALAIRKVERGHNVVVELLARGVHHVEPGIASRRSLRRNDCLVHVARAKAAAKDQKHRGVLGDENAARPASREAPRTLRRTGLPVSTMASSPWT